MIINNMTAMPGKRSVCESVTMIINNMTAIPGKKVSGLECHNDYQ